MRPASARPNSALLYARGRRISPVHTRAACADGRATPASIRADPPCPVARWRRPRRLFTSPIYAADDQARSRPSRVELPAVAPASTYRCSRTTRLIGAIDIYRQEVRPFTDKQIELVRISPTRPSSPSRTRGCSTSCAKDRCEQQTATAEVAKVISSSPGELEPVFEAMLANATRICEAKFGMFAVTRRDPLRRVARYTAPAAIASTAAAASIPSGQASRRAIAPSRSPSMPITTFRPYVDNPIRSSDRRASGAPARIARRADAQGQRADRRDRPSTARRYGRSPTSRSSW